MIDRIEARIVMISMGIAFLVSIGLIMSLKRPESPSQIQAELRRAWEDQNKYCADRGYIVRGDGTDDPKVATACWQLLEERMQSGGGRIIAGPTQKLNAPASPQKEEK